MTSTYLRQVVRVWGLLVAVVLVVVMTALADPFDPQSVGPGQDARAYWAAPLDAPYVPGSVGHESAYLYSPAFLVALSPLRALPWPLFVAAWTILLLAVLYWLARPLLFLPLLVVALPEIWGGNITILLAAAIVVGLSRPAGWALPLLTKVTPGVGVLWFGFRREWSKLAVALLATAAIIGVTAIVTPGLWAEWTSVARQQHRVEHRAGLGAHPTRHAPARGGPRHRMGRPHRASLASAGRRAPRDARHLVG